MSGTSYDLSLQYSDFKVLGFRVSTSNESGVKVADIADFSFTKHMVAPNEKDTKRFVRYQSDGKVFSNSPFKIPQSTPAKGLTVSIVPGGVNDSEALEKTPVTLENQDVSKIDSVTLFADGRYEVALKKNVYDYNSSFVRVKIQETFPSTSADIVALDESGRSFIRV